MSKGKTKITFRLNDLHARIKNIVKDFKSEKFSKHITNQLVSKIRKDSFRFKTGKPFRKLEESTIENRKKLAKHNRKNRAYKANKPNLTFTGRLLNSVKGRFKAKKSSITLLIDVSGTHAPYKYNGKELGKPKPNKEIRKHLAKIGRDPLELSKKAKNNLSRIIQAIIRERLK